MTKTIILIILIGLVPVTVLAHLCNDVFMQAKDNLAVKVDIRDGQLRINKDAKFRVYLFNSMDRDISQIRLQVLTRDFQTKVTPSPEWRNYPGLRVRKNSILKWT